MWATYNDFVSAYAGSLVDNGTAVSGVNRFFLDCANRPLEYDSGNGVGQSGATAWTNYRDQNTSTPMSAVTDLNQLKVGDVIVLNYSTALNLTKNGGWIGFVNSISENSLYLFGQGRNFYSQEFGYVQFPKANYNLFLGGIRYSGWNDNTPVDPPQPPEPANPYPTLKFNSHSHIPILAKSIKI